MRKPRGYLALAIAVVLAMITPGRTASSLPEAQPSRAWGAVVAAQPAMAAPFLLLEPLSLPPGGNLKVSGFGFAPNSTVELTLSAANRTTQPGGTVTTDESGRFLGQPLDLPEWLQAGAFEVRGRQDGGGPEIVARGFISTSLAGVQLDSGAGKAGDRVAVDGWEFSPGEKVRVYLNGIAGSPFAELTVDEKGRFAKQPITLPYGPTGENVLVFVGERSQMPVLASYMMIGFYPTVGLSTYAPRGDEVVGFMGEGFGPRERVRVHLNNLDSPPVAMVETDERGKFSVEEGFAVPFGWYGKQSFLFVGERSATTVAAGFEVMKYNPYTEPSAWSGRAGTTITFYGGGFARSERVHVFRAATPTSPSEESSCLVTDASGAVYGQGEYTVQLGDQPGKLNLQLVGEKSQVSVSVTVEVLRTSSKAPPAQVAPNPGCQ